MSADVIHLGGREKRGLDVEGLDRDLRLLWRDAGESDGAVRACLGNLIVAAGAGEDPIELLSDVTRLHPMRVIVVRDVPSLPEGAIEAWVSATCARRPRERALICGETVTLETGPGAGARVPSALRALCLGALPRAVLVAGGSPSARTWVDAFSRECDLLVADSATLSGDGALALWRRCRHGAAPSCRDLAWTRLRDWRRAFRVAFDDAGNTARLPAIREVRLVMRRDSGARAVASLLLGWLASRLDWPPVHREPGPPPAVRFGPGPDGVAGSIVEEAGGDDPAVVRSIDITFTGGNGLRWRRLSAERAIVVETREGGLVARLAHAKTGPAAALVRELRNRAPGTAAEAAMKRAADVRAALGEQT